MSIQIRPGSPQDIPAIHALVRELAIYEQAEAEHTVSIEEMKEHAFGPQAYFSFLVAENEAQQILGMALYFFSYSTWKGPCLYLEDLVVKEDCRRQGIGQLLFDELLQIAKTKKVGRMSWQVLDWNAPAIAFYKKLGAQLDESWINCQFRKEFIENY